MNNLDLQHKELIKKILSQGHLKNDRTGVGTKSIFGAQMRFKMKEGFPLLTLRKIHTKSLIHEILWFLGAYDNKKFGNTNIRYLIENGVTFWTDWPLKNYNENNIEKLSQKEFEKKILEDDNFALQWGDLGPVYGKQWINCDGVNQIDNIIDQLKNDPDSRRMLVDSWNVAEIPHMMLPPCFLPGVKVQTLNQYKNIEDIDFGDKVLTHKGNFKKVDKVFKTPYSGKILKIRPRYVSNEFSCTPNHPFLIRGKGWVEAKDISIQDKLAIKINKNSIVPELDIKTGVNQYKNFKINKVKLDNIDDWYIMGYFLGDGWINHLNAKKGQIFFAINSEQEEKILLKFCKRISLYKIKNHVVSKVHKFECRNKQWYNILKEFGRFSHGKIIPDWVQNAPNEYIIKFLEGYQDSDGSTIKRNNSKMFSTTSNDISYGIQRLFAKIGKVSSHVFQKRKEITKIMGRTVNQKSTYNISLNNRPHKSRFDFDDEYLYVGISKIEEIDVKDVFVYNLSVKDDNSYTVNNICTHNCHMLFQFYSHEMNKESRFYEFSKWKQNYGIPMKDTIEKHNFPTRRLSLQLYIRSQDIFLGQPFNIAEYALLLHMIGQIVNMVPYELIYTMGDAHLYLNSIDAANKMMERFSYDLPSLTLNRDIKSIYDFRYDDIHIENYKSHANIKVDVAV